MTGRHRGHRAPLPLGWLVLALLLVAGGVFVVRPILTRSDAKPAGAAPGSSPAASMSPTSSPSATPSPSTSPSPARRGKLVIHAAGDVNLDPSYIPNFRSQGYGYAWAGLGDLFKDDDLTLVNLECAVSNEGTAVPKEFNFRGDPAALPAMKRAGVDVANMANNHSYDFGPEALVDTRRNLVRNRIAPVGAGKDEQQALSPALFDINGWKVAVVGFDLVVDPFPEAVATASKPGTAAGHDTGLMVRTVRSISRDADLVIVTIHWGVELDTQPRADQVALAHRFIDAGADMIFGGHSHRLQPEIPYRGKPVFYSLGNFVWPNFSVAGSTTGVAEVVVRPDGGIRAKLLPAFIEAAGHPVLR